MLEKLVCYSKNLHPSLSPLNGHICLFFTSSYMEKALTQWYTLEVWAQPWFMWFIGQDILIIQLGGSECGGDLTGVAYL